MLTRGRGFAAVVVTLLLAACGGGGGGSSSPPPPPPAAPTITTQPVSQTVNAGTNVTFTVAATGATSYQWQRNGAAISGATGTSYSLSPATSANNGDSYVVVATNAGGSATSATATLRVTGVAVLAGQIGAGGYADGPVAQSRFWGPAALALDSAGNLYVADYNAIRKISTAGVVSTIAGSPRTCGDSGGPGATALLCYPFALATDAAGNVYVGDGGSSVWQILPSGFVQSYGGAYSCVSALANVDPVLYVGDGCAAATIFKVTNGVATSFASLGAGPGGLSVDAFQNLYAANSSIVQQVTPSGAVSTLAGVSGLTGSADGQGSAARFGCALHPGGPNFLTGNGAVAIATLPSGTSFVADYCNNSIRQVTPGGAVTTVVGVAGAPPGAIDATTGGSARLWAPAAVVADPGGNLYVADYLNGLIRKVTAAGVVSTYAGLTPHAGYQDGAAAQAAFRYPYGVVADSAGNLYVADSNNFVIRKITPDGTVSTLAGTPSVEGTADGTGSKALFDEPQAIAIDANGNLYVADSNSSRIRRVTPGGAVTTLPVLITGASRTMLVHPNAVAIDPSGNLIVGDNFGLY